MKIRRVMSLLIIILLISTLTSVSAEINLLDLLKGGQQKSPEEIASGLQEALRVGTQNSVKLTGCADGYFANQAIKILLPEQLQDAGKILRNFGQGAKVDEFVLTMNRAAEKAAPFAKDIFWGAINKMTFEDAVKIFKGNDTAATEYFKAKTYDKLKALFQPPVTKAMNEVGVTRSYKDLVERTKTIPLIKVETVDIDQYVVTKALDGLFYMLGQEEQKIRTDPAARVTEILKEVFGG
jgi:hypothetical protein